MALISTFSTSPAYKNVSALKLPAFGAELLVAAPGKLTRLKLLAEALPYAPFDDLFAVHDSPTSRCPTLSVYPP